MKYIIIGERIRSVASNHPELISWIQERRELGNRVFFTILRTTPVCGGFVETERVSWLIALHIVKDHSQHTIGVEFSSRTVHLGEKRIKLQVSTCINVLKSSI